MRQLCLKNYLLIGSHRDAETQSKNFEEKIWNI
jgi:hypothetical protein